MSERDIEQVIRLRAQVDAARRRVDVGVYRAVRVKGIPVRVLAAHLGLTRARVYQMVRNGAARLDE